MEGSEPMEHAPDEQAPPPEGAVERTATPTPVRAAMAPAAPPEPVAAAAPVPKEPAAEAPLEVEGVRWVVRVLGRSGSGASDAPLLLLGFFHPEEPGAPRKESWVVARGLAGLTELQLESAFQAGVAPAPAGERRPFFPEIASRGAKDG